nr:MAG TPA: U1/U12 small nuclear ribonucleoprotein [Caudoviricetes sp.]
MFCGAKQWNSCPFEKHYTVIALRLQYFMV